MIGIGIDVEVGVGIGIGIGVGVGVGAEDQSSRGKGNLGGGGWVLNHVIDVCNLCAFAPCHTSCYRTDNELSFLCVKS